jgi:hypothetical protein
MTRYRAGFAPDQILTMRLDIRGPQYRDQKVRHDFASALVSKAKNDAWRPRRRHDNRPWINDACHQGGRGCPGAGRAPRR